MIPAIYLRVDLPAEGGLPVPSQSQIDKPHTLARGKVGNVIGEVGRDTLASVNRAMMLFCGLA